MGNIRKKVQPLTMSKLIVLVGSTGTGKTTLAKKMLDKIPKHLVNDINDDYEEYICYNPLKEIEDFLNYCNKITNTFIVVDEAAIYFKKNTKNSGKLKNLLQLKRHTKNNFLLIFHEICEIPKEILNKIDIMILFKTGDIYNDVAKKFGKNSTIIDNYAKVKKHQFKHFYIQFDFANSI